MVHSKLIIMRHAKSSWNYPNLSDHDRPLNKRGKKDAPRISQALVERKWMPDLILLSSSTRTNETLMNMNFNNEITVEVRPKIYLAGISQLILELESIIEGGTTMILGHNPGCELLINHLTGEWHEMPTAAAALLVQIDCQWVVDSILRPKEL